jgi:hypothetical protein
MSKALIAKGYLQAKENLRFRSRQLTGQETRASSRLIGKRSIVRCHAADQAPRLVHCKRLSTNCKASADMRMKKPGAV